MTSELRKFIQLVIELMLLGGVITVAVASALIGRASLNAYVAQQDARDLLPQTVAYTKGSVGYYELVDLIDAYAPTTDVVIQYNDNTGSSSTITFTSALDGMTVKLAIGDTLPQRGVAFSGIVYSRLNGRLYRDGFETTTQVFENDLKLPLNTLQALNSLSGNGVLDYNFLEILFDWAKDERFVCTLTQTYETGNIDSITLEMRN